MVRNSSGKKDLQCYSYFRSAYDFSLFKKTPTSRGMIGYSILFLVLVMLVNVLKKLMTYSTFTYTQIITLSIIGIPIFLICVYGLFYVFLRAFENKKLAFFKGFLVFATVTLPFIFLGHVLNLLSFVFVSSVLYEVFRVLLFVMLVYFIVNLILHLKTYFKVSGYRIVTSFILVDFVVMFIGMVQYLAYIASSV